MSCNACQFCKWALGGPKKCDCRSCSGGCMKPGGACEAPKCPKCGGPMVEKQSGAVACADRECYAKPKTLTVAEFQERLLGGFFGWTGRRERTASSWALSLREWASREYAETYPSDFPKKSS